MTTGPPSVAVQQNQTSLNASPPAHPIESGELVAAVVSNANVPNPEIGSGVSHESFACANALPAEIIIAKNVIPMYIVFIALPPWRRGSAPSKSNLRRHPIESSELPAEQAITSFRRQNSQRPNQSIARNPERRSRR